MAGYRAELDAMAAAAAVLRGSVDSVTAALDHLDAGVCASLGPGRLGPAAARLTENARLDLDRLLATLVEDGDLVAAAARAYAEHDQAAADELTRRAGGPG